MCIRDRVFLSGRQSQSWFGLPVRERPHWHHELEDIRLDDRGYSYDFGVNDLSVIGRSSHEIVISLTACDKNDPYVGPNGRCPAYD